MCKGIPHHLPDVISQEEILFLHVEQLETVEKDFNVVHLTSKFKQRRFDYFHLKTGGLLDFVEVDIRPRIGPLARHDHNST